MTTPKKKTVPTNEYHTDRFAPPIPAPPMPLKASAAIPTSAYSTPLTYFGSKKRLAPAIISLFPPNFQNLTYIEAFGGGAAILFAKPKSRLEIYNDLDGAAVNFFRVLRDDPAELKRRLTLTPFSRGEYEQCRNGYEAVIDPIEYARQYYVLIMQSFSKRFCAGWTFKRDTDTPGSFANKVDNLEWTAERLRGVMIEHLDFRKLIAKHDSDHAFWVCDPPYAPTTRSSNADKYRCEMTLQDHLDLLAMLKEVKGRVLLCGYYCEEYARALKGWEMRSASVQSLSGRVGERRTETVWTNYSLPKPDNTIALAA
ncbi:MAG: DNA adenine methylase [Phycisphaerae bacterium]